MTRVDLTKPHVPTALPLAVGEAETARLLGVSARTLFNWRADGRGPRFVRVGARILYGVDELRRWLNEAAVGKPVSPAEQGPGPNEGGDA